MAGLSLTLPIAFSDSSLPKLPIVLASDSFNRAEGQLGTSDAALGGTPRVWAVDANISIYANRWRAAGQSVNRSSRVDTGQADHRVNAKWYTGTGGALLARYSDANNYYRLDIADNGLAFYRHAGGTSTPLRDIAAMVAPGDTVSLQASGNVVTVQLNGTTIWEYTDTAANAPSGTRTGLRSAWSTETVFDDFLVTNT